jgi:hypothetical protein
MRCDKHLVEIYNTVMKLQPCFQREVHKNKRLKGEWESPGGARPGGESSVHTKQRRDKNPSCELSKRKEKQTHPEPGVAWNC